MFKRRNGARPWRAASAMVLTAALIAGPATAQPAAEPPSALALVTGATPPFSDAPGERGFLTLLAEDAFGRIGIRISVVRLPTERALANVNAGIDDGDVFRIGGLQKTYPDLLQVPEPIFGFEFVGFTTGLDFPVTGFESLARYEVGVVNGWKFYENHLGTGQHVTFVRSIEQLFELLRLGRIDVALLERYQGLWWARREARMDVRVLERALGREDMFIYLNRRHAALVPRLADALRAMKADGTYERLLGQTLRRLTMLEIRHAMLISAPDVALLRHRPATAAFQGAELR